MIPHKRAEKIRTLFLDAVLMRGGSIGENVSWVAVAGAPRHYDKFAGKTRCRMRCSGGGTCGLESCCAWRVRARARFVHDTWPRWCRLHDHALLM
eukprot:5998929-Amphidinium_carterae.1